MYAVIKTGGKQYRVAERDVINIEKLDSEIGAEVEFDVLAVGQGAGLKIGAPTVEGAKVTGKVLRQDRGKKVIIYKFKRRKKYRRKNGHRQSYTQVQITSIAG